MNEPESVSIATERAPLLSTRKIVHMSMLIFAFLLPYLTWMQAAGCALLALAFNVVILPRLGADLSKRQRHVTSEGVEALPKPASTWTGIVWYPISVLGLILLYRRHMEVVGAAWAIMAWGDGVAGIVGEAFASPALPWNRTKTWSGFLGFIAAGTAGAYLLIRWIAPGADPGTVLNISAAAALAGALVESAPVGIDDNITVPLLTGAVLYCLSFVERTALDSNMPYLGRRVPLALAVNLALALVALALKTVNPSGAVVGALLGFAVYLGWGYKTFLLLFAFFLIGSVATRMGYARKAARGVAEKRGGARSWREALANTLSGAFFSLLVITTHHERAFLMAVIAAFAEGLGDTVSSEIGQWISGRAYLITTFRPVPAGENGGVSLAGSVAGATASALVVALAFGLGLCGPAGVVITLTAAIAGNALDSVLGATLERRGLVTNGIVNFAGTSFAGGLALAIALRLGF